MGCKVITGYLMAAASSKDPVINRVEAFSDGVIAIAITLLALGLEVRQVQLTASPNLLLHALLAEWSRFAIFVLSFILIGEVPGNHHRMFSYIHRSAHWLIWLNLGLLLSVVVIPFATELLGEYELQPGSQLVATVIYGATWTLGGVFYNALWWYASHNHRLIDPDLDVQPITRRWILGPILWRQHALSLH
jgi:uncharacterized membrane protein